MVTQCENFKKVIHSHYQSVFLTAVPFISRNHTAQHPYVMSGPVISVAERTDQRVHSTA